MSEPIAFLGLGVMGGYMAANLAKQGYSVTGWNRTPDRPGSAIAAQAGVAIAATLQDAVKNTPVIISCLGDVPDVEAVLVGEVTKFAPANALVIDMSTIGSSGARDIGAKLAAQGFRFLDAPVSGGDVGAKNAKLTIMVGGDAADFAIAQPYFAAMGQAVTHCGGVGNGQAVKMCNQILGAMNLVGVCEAMLLAETQGIDPQLIVEVCNRGASASWTLENLGMKVAEGDFDPGFMVKHILKDLRLVQEIAANGSQELPGTQYADRLFKDVEALGGAEQGTQAMIRAYREAAPPN
jgi:3-hydroxyisobutyrate dehydrogenase